MESASPRSTVVFEGWYFSMLLSHAVSIDLPFQYVYVFSLFWWKRVILNLNILESHWPKMLCSKKSWNSRLSSYCRNTVYFLNLHTSVTCFGCFLILRYFRCKQSASSKWVIREWVLKRVAIVLLGVAKQTKRERHEFTSVKKGIFNTVVIELNRSSSFIH